MKVLFVCLKCKEFQEIILGTKALNKYCLAMLLQITEKEYDT